MTARYCKLYYFDMCRPKLHQTYYFGSILTILFTCRPIMLYTIEFLAEITHNDLPTCILQRLNVLQIMNGRITWHFWSTLQVISTIEI